MILKNLLRRKSRTLLTVLGISIGVAAIIGLGAMADGLEAGYSSMLGGSQADFVLSDPEAMDISLSSLDENLSIELADLPEVEAVSALLQGIVQVGNSPYFFVFSYPEDSFSLDRYDVIEGIGIYDHAAQNGTGRPVLLL